MLMFLLLLFVSLAWPQAWPAGLYQKTKKHNISNWPLYQTTQTMVEIHRITKKHTEKTNKQQINTGTNHKLQKHKKTKKHEQPPTT